MRACLLLLAALATGPGLALAAPVTVFFEGVVGGAPDFPRVQDSFSLLPEISPGDTFSGTYFYDDGISAAPCGSATPLEECARYDFGNQPTAGITFEINGIRFSFDNSEDPEIPLLIRLIDNDMFDNDSYNVDWIRSGRFGTVLIDGIFLILRQQAPNSLLDTTELIVPDPEAASSQFFQFIPRLVPGQGESSFSGSIASLRVVPEPTTSSLLLLFALTLCALRRP